MKCPICQADAPHGVRFCPSCGSNLSTRGGADIVVSQDGTAHHAGSSRWKTGGGLAAGGVLVGLLKAGPLLLFKAYWIFSLVRLAGYGGYAAILAVLAIAGIALSSLFRFRRRIFPL